MRHFYSPLLGLRAEIQMRSELRERLHAHADAEWQRLCRDARDRGGPDALLKLEQDRWKEFGSLIEYDNKQLVEQLIPAYRQMVRTFRDDFWLADVDTRSHFRALLEFVEIWERWLVQAVPHEVIRAVGHGESALRMFLRAY